MVAREAVGAAGRVGGVRRSGCAGRAGPARSKRSGRSLAPTAQARADTSLALSSNTLGNRNPGKLSTPHSPFFSSWGILSLLTNDFYSGSVHLCRQCRIFYLRVFFRCSLKLNKICYILRNNYISF